MDAAKKRKSDWMFWTMVTLTVVLVLYPLSLGPMNYLLAKSKGKPKAVWDVILATYAPVDFLLQCTAPSVRHSYDRYVDWWWDLAEN